MKRLPFSLATALFTFVLWAQGSPELKITHGPVLEGASPTTATIAWTTNVNSGTRVLYGLDPQHLLEKAEVPWGGITHRITLKNLQPNTTYYWQAVATKGQGSGEDVTSKVQSFTTAAGLGQPR